MSREKECKCCHEWWYSSDIKENLCPNCYDYFKQLKQELAKKDKEIKSLIADYEKRISQEQELMSNMEHQLTEKQNTIDEINKEFVQSVKDWKVLCAEKDKEIEEILSSKKHFKTCAENMSDVLKTINSVLPKPQENGLNYKKVADDVIALIKEKDKEIERLKFFERIYYQNQLQASQEDIQQFQQLANQSAVNINHIAITELEKVKVLAEKLLEDFCNSWQYNQRSLRGHRHIEYYDLIQGIDNQIKELKGEKDVG